MLGVLNLNITDCPEPSPPKEGTLLPSQRSAAQCSYGLHSLMYAAALLQMS